MYEAIAYTVPTGATEGEFFYRLFFLWESDGGGMFAGPYSVMVSDNACVVYTESVKGGLLFDCRLDPAETGLLLVSVPMGGCRRHAQAPTL